MNIEKAQKVNALAHELRKHNFASSSEDAIEQAEQIFNDKPIKTEEKEAVSMQSDQPDLMAEKKFEMILEMNNKQHEQELALIRSALNQLSSELQSVRSELKRLSEANPVPKERQEPLKTEIKEKHPRQGDYTSDDVDIQKVFYCGNKSQ